MDVNWKDSFLQKLNQAQAECGKRFEEALDKHVRPAFEELNGFLRDNGFALSQPLQEPGRRSFKFELAENAYVLFMFRFYGVGEFELRTETFVPAHEPIFGKAVGRVADIEQRWAVAQFQSGLDYFVELLAGTKNGEQAPAKGPDAPIADEELVVA